MSEEKDVKGLSDIFKKVVSTGMSAAFMTEDAVKEVIGGLPLPKELVNTLLQNAKTTRDDFLGSVKNELRTRLDKIDISKELERVLENYDFEVNAKISLKRKPTEEVATKTPRRKTSNK